MAKKVILKDWNNIEILPMTRGELVLDSSGKLAFHSNEFLATQSLPGLMSATDKNKLDNFQGDTYELSGVISDDKYITTLTSSKGVITNAVIEPMQGATVDLAGKVGLVPAPLAGYQNKFLSGDGTWKFPAETSLTAEEILEKLKTVDGSGSGLDADLLDGKQPSELSVLSASKLTTARILWGQSFDGTADINGDLTLDNNKFIIAKNSNGVTNSILGINQWNELHIGEGVASSGFSSVLYGNNIVLCVGKDKTDTFRINANGNILSNVNTGKVGIGTTTPSYKLDIFEPIADNIFRASGASNTFRVTSSGVGAYNHTNGGWAIYAGSASSESARFEVIDKNGTWTGKGWTLFKNGNMVIGKSTDSGYKLDVTGNVQIGEKLRLLSSDGIYDGLIQLIEGNLAITSTKIGVEYTNLILANHGGNVGIGTASPTEKLTVNGNVLATKFITSGGTSSQFVKGDGSLDSNTYATTILLGLYLPLSGGDLNGTLRIIPTNQSGVQEGLILHDRGSGAGESLRVKWTSNNYTTGVSLWADLSAKTLKFSDGSMSYNVIHSGGGTINGDLLISDPYQSELQLGTGGILYYNEADSTIALYLRGSNYPLIKLRNDAAYPIFRYNYTDNIIWHSGNLTKLSQLTDDVINGKYLPLTGGAITGALDISTTNSVGLTLNRENADVGATMSIIFKKNGEFVNRILAKHENTNLYRVDANDNRYVIWDSGNLTPTAILTQLKTVDGSGSGLDADLLDGLDSSRYGQSIENDSGLDLNASRNGFRAGKLYAATNAANELASYRGFLEYGTGGYVAQFNSDNNNIYYRWCENGNWTSWRRIAFVDSNITGIAASADKLKTKRKLWGLDFDGTADVSGSITVGNGSIILNNAYSLKSVDKSGISRELLYLNSNNNCVLGDGISELGTDTYIRGNNLYLQYGSSKNTGIVLTNEGKIGVCKSSPKHTLDISGNIGLTELLNFSDANYAYITVPSEGELCFNVGSAGTANTKMILVSSGNVGIGTNDPQSKLQVAGTTTINGTIIQNFKNNWLNSAILQLGRIDPGVYSDRAIIGVTDGNLHLDAYKNKSIYLNYYQDPGTTNGQASTAVIINSNGNVGIGTTNSSYKLDVNGDTLVRGQIIHNDAPGPDGIGVPGAGAFSYSNSWSDTLHTKKSFIGSTYNSTYNAWFNCISVRHRNGHGDDGNKYGIYIGCRLDNSNENDLFWNKLYNGSWLGERTLLDSANWTSLIGGSVFREYYHWPGGNLANFGDDNHSNGIFYVNEADSNTIKGAPFYYGSVLNLSCGASSVLIAFRESHNYVYLRTRWRSDNGYGWAGWTRLVTQSFDSDIYANHYYENSDIQLKTNIQEILNSDKMPIIKEFDWKEDNLHSYGLIAQELEELGYSELVYTKDDGYKTVNYSAALSLIVGKLLVKIKELEKLIETLKNKN